MKRTLLAPLALLVAALPAAAQDATPKVSGLLQVWYTQMLSDNLRLDGAAKTNGNGYYDLSGNYTENTFLIRRSEIHVSGTIPNVDGLTYEFNIDPSINTSTASATNSNASYNPTILQDAYLNYKLENGFEFRIGQFKNQQTMEGYNSASTLIFAERSQLGRRFGDKRDRGFTAGWNFGDQDFGGKATLGAFNGTTDLASGKANDTNAQKDFVGRLEFNLGKTQKFGVYTLQGATDQKDNGTLLAKTFAGGAAAPAAADVYADKDKTTNLGAFYAYDDGTWHFDAEAITGKWGRRFASVTNTAPVPPATTVPAGRESLDQQYLSYYATAAYTFGAHTFALRYDFLNANKGDDWYTAYDPYTESAPGVARLVNGSPVDYTPKYREITFGYTYAFNPKVVKAANFKLNYIARSKNFLAPSTNATGILGLQTGEQGGDTVIAAFQIAF